MASMGGAVSSIFGGIGDLEEAAAYGKAAGYADQNAKLSTESTGIQEYQAQRQIQRTLGLQKAQVAGAGLAASGSALDILRDSQSQGALTKGLIQVQGTINTNSYQEEAAAYKGQQSAATMSGIGNIGGGVLGLLGF